MNFQSLSKIEKYDVYIDMAFGAAKKKAELAKQKTIKQKLYKSRYVESVRVQAVSGTLMKKITLILTSFPSIDSLPEFYNQLIKATLDYATLKKSLAALRWVQKKISELESFYVSKINKCQHHKNIGDYRKQFYGRVNSLIRQIRNELEYLEFARKTMRSYPSIKTSIFTVSICGFPNVGKTTLLSKITDADPEVNSYSFTTKGINIGYIRNEQKKRIVQLLDTPGTLNRFNKMNTIEQVAYLALKYASHFLVYVFDLTEPYPLEKQKELLRNIKKEHDQEPLIFLSKADILPAEEIENFKKKYDCITDPDELLSILENKSIEYNKILKEQELKEKDSDTESLDNDDQDFDDYCDEEYLDEDYDDEDL